jgi:hypothetical protein
MKTSLAVRAVLLATAALCTGGGPRAAGGLIPGITLGGADTGAETTQVTYGNGTFLASWDYLFAPPGGTTATSPDGVHWTAHVTTNAVVVGNCSKVSPGNGNFVACGNTATYYGAPAGTNGLVQFSPDGVVWGQPVVIPSMPLSDVVYAKGTYVAVGETGGTGALATSSDGTNWATQTFTGYGPLHGVTAGGGTFVALGDSGVVFSSTDGLRWQPHVLVPGANILAVAYGNGEFVANTADYILTPTNTAAYIVTSTNGTDWVVTAPSMRLPVGPPAFAGLGLDCVWEWAIRRYHQEYSGFHQRH